MRALLAFMLAACAATTARAEGEVVWNRLDVVARLGDEGRLQVTETHEITVRGDVSRVDRDFGLGVAQSVASVSLVRLDSDGSPHPLTAGDVKQGDRYVVYPAWMQWSLRGEGSAPFEDESRRYVLRYELLNAIAPAWDLPNGSEALDPLHPSYRSPLVGVREAWPLWREAWPRLDRRYRLDHDVLFPNRGKPGWSLVQLDYHLEWDEAHWRLLDPERDIGRATPDVDYRVQQALEYLAEGRPGAVDLRAPAVRTGSIVGLPAACALLWLLAFALNRLRLGLGPAANRELFEASVLAEPPELVRARIEGDAQPPGFESLLLRLAAERKVAIDILEPGDDDPPVTRLRLLVPKPNLHTLEREVLDALMGQASEITSAEVQTRHKGREFDPQEILEASFERVKPRALGAGKVVRALSIALMAGGVILALMDLQTPIRVAYPYAIVAGILGGLVTGSLPFPMVLLSAANAALQLVPSVPLSPAGAAGIAVLLLARYPTRLRVAPSRTSEPARRRDDLLRARSWAATELKKARPLLEDAWIPHLVALGLGPAIDRWKKRHGGAATFGAPDLADVQDPQAYAGPPFTGYAPEAPALEDEWYDGFFVTEDEPDAEG
jgi:hypothetical protein